MGAIDQDGSTPLHYACINDNVAMTQLLLTFGADMMITDKMGRTAYSVAKGNTLRFVQITESANKNIAIQIPTSLPKEKHESEARYLPSLLRLPYPQRHVFRGPQEHGRLCSYQPDGTCRCRFAILQSWKRHHEIVPKREKEDPRDIPRDYSESFKQHVDSSRCGSDFRRTENSDNADSYSNEKETRSHAEEVDVSVGSSQDSRQKNDTRRGSEGEKRSDAEGTTYRTVENS